MLTSLQNVHEEFFKLFIPTITVGSLVIPVRYARSSRLNLTEKSSESYPICVIYDKQPEFDTQWTDSFFEYVGGYRFNDISDTKKITDAYVYKEPIRFICSYDVTFYLKGIKDKWKVIDYILSNHGKNGTFVFNKVTLSNNQQEGDIGDVVFYDLTMYENQRQDGIVELNFQFQLSAMVDIQTEVDKTVVQTLILNI